ncbi:glycoside hydrolase family 3 protein [Paraferrimonas sp. SM1919]|uniref:glycoside hydrolase family 3 protein n=1 Tax=Paraferrimonas sp. SM1919 TaxID=2662263 RepID=UPI0013D712A0|nr:glycoside hydrolase family 3 N-terminal domain-containing protein [Paraferrimonas sp. SM1919]
MKKLYLASLISLGLIAGCGDKAAPESSTAQIWPDLTAEIAKQPNVEAQVAKILATMTLEQKVAQMIQPEIRDITVEDMRKYGFGSFLNGGGAFPDNNKHATPQDWIALAESLYQASIDDSLDGSTIPTMWGTDAVHGHNNVIGATLFPHNIGLGAANNPALIEQIAKATATEVMATGIDWVFAPTVAAVRDDRWGRTYEGYSEHPDIIRDYSAAIVTGLQGPLDGDFLGDERVISTVKHFIGDGGTVDGDDQGNNIASEQELFDIHAQGYVGGLTAGAQSVMASFNSWHGSKIHGDKYLLTDVLKEQMGFDGFVVGDWNGHGQVKGCSNESCPQAVNAGLDIYMVPGASWKPLYYNTIEQVKSGEIPMARIDDAVTRILRVKVRAGLFEKPSPANRPLAGKLELIGKAEHREIAKDAVRQSLVLLKNNDNILPLKPNQNVLVAGDGADNIGKQSGGWTITWQGTNNVNADFPGGSSVYDGIKQQVTAAGGKVELSVAGDYSQKPDVAIVVFGEEPYAEGVGDIKQLEYQVGNKKDLALLNKLKAQGIPVVSLFITGRPLWVNPEINASNAFAAIWLPGSEGAAVADVIFTDAEGQVQYDFGGKLSYSWPKQNNQFVLNHQDENYDPLFAYGYGLSYQDTKQLPQLNEQPALKVEASNELAVYPGDDQGLWTKTIVAADGQHKVNDAVQAEAGVSIRTYDHHVQEDSTLVTFNGEAEVGFALMSSNAFGQDLSQMVDANAVLSFSAKALELSNDAVELTFNNDGKTITTPINQHLKLDQWQSISISVSCLIDAGFNVSQVHSPFTLTSKGKQQIAIGDIRFSKDTAEQQSICIKL